MYNLIKQNNGNKFSVELTILIVLSWALYPWAVSWIYPVLVRITFATGLALIIARLYFDGGESKQKKLDDWEKLFFVIWASYLLCSFAATFVFNNGNLDLFIRYLLKTIFFLILFFYLDRKTIFLSFDIYANLAVVLVTLSMMAILGIAFGWIDKSLISVTRGIDNYGEMRLVFSGFDGNARIFSETSRFMRMQSFAIEPGAFSLAIFPALYWFAFVRKHIFRTIVILLGIAGSWSLGALLAMILALLVLYGNKSAERFGKLVLLFGAAFFILTHLVFTVVVSPSEASSSMLAGDRSLSIHQRIDELIQVVNYTSENFWGSGVGAGRNTLKSSISVGYANVFADSGILGGSLYLLAFLLMGYEATKGALGKLVSISDAQLSSSVVAIGLSVLTCLFFGLQREQPDASYWHMWIYASFFSLYGISRKEGCAEK